MSDFVSRELVHEMLENISVNDTDKWFNWVQKASNRLADIPTVNAIIIPDNATNGDIIKTLFDVKEVRKYKTRVTVWTSLNGCYIVPIDFQLKWWNAPYKENKE